MHAFFQDGPPQLKLNAWTGTSTATATPSNEQLHAWLRSQAAAPPPPQRDRAPGLIHEWDWTSPKVGWGLVLPDNPALPAAERATAADAPEPIQRLVAARNNAPVLRWRATASGIGQLLRYTPDGRVYDLALHTEDGLAPRQMPRFLMIYAPPSQIPWAFQYAANLRRHIGRLWLQGEALNNYITALINDWADAQCDVHAPLVWSVDHGQPDITWLMDRAISRKLAERWAQDPDQDFARATQLLGPDASHEQLIAQLTNTRPALVVTTSHGMTGPLDDSQQMAAQLGLPVDNRHRVLDIEALCQRWQPDGAIWYAHACCSAGSDAPSTYAGLAGMGTDVARILSGVAAGCAASIAPLPQRLLGAKRPLRAFIGHVEPTFDWGLRDPETGQPLSHSLLRALYDKLFEGGERRAIGWAMDEVFREVGVLLDEGKHALAAIKPDLPRSLSKALYFQIAAMDRQQMVVLGDPVVGFGASSQLGVGCR